MGLPIKVNASELSNDDVKYSNVKVSSVGGKSVNILNKNDITPIDMALKGSNVQIYWLLADENEKFSINSLFILS